MRKYRLQDGTKLSYQFTGIGEQVILLLHGRNGSHSDMKHIAEFLDDDYAILNIDLHGHGQSEYNRSVKIDTQSITEDILELLGYLSISNPIIIGYKEGANIALRLGVDRVLNAKAIITISASTGVFGTKLSWLFLRFLKRFWYSVLSVFDSKQSIAQSSGTTVIRSKRILRKKLHQISVKTLLIYTHNDSIRKSHYAMLHKEISSSSIILYHNLAKSSILENEELLDDILAFIIKI